MKTRSLLILLLAVVVLTSFLPFVQAEVNVAKKLKIISHGSDFDPVTGTTSLSYALKNPSRTILPGPFRVVVEGVGNADVWLINPDGHTLDGRPYFEYPVEELGQGETTADRIWTFDHRCETKLLLTLAKNSPNKPLSLNTNCEAHATLYYSIYTPEEGTNRLPVAEAGPDQKGRRGKSIELDGSGSTDIDGDSLTYKWSLVSKPSGSSAVLKKSKTVRPTLKPDLAGTYVVKLVVSDGTSTSDSDLTKISTGNVGPVANAGPDQTAAPGETVWLDGTRSTDANGNPLTYQWSFLSMPEGSTVTPSEPGAARPFFTPDLPGIYILQLVVKDKKLGSAPDISTISLDNSRPVAHAGYDQTVNPGDTVNLDGSGSTDLDGDPLTYTWSLIHKPSSSTATLNDPNTVKPSFTADLPGDYVAQLMVNDGTMDSAPSTVIISTTNSRPVADPGPDQAATEGETIYLDGIGSTDADGDPLTYLWSFVSKPVGSQAIFSNAKIINPTFEIDLPGTYVIQLMVSDARTTSLPRTCVVTTENSRPLADAGPDQVVDEGDMVSLDGTDSYDPDEGPLTYLWSILHKPLGSTVALGDPTVMTHTFTPDLVGSYVFQLMVSDGQLRSLPDTVAVRVTIQMIDVPNIVGMTQTEAESAITSASLTLGSVTTDYSDTVPADHVISQDPLAGTSVPEGSSVSLVVSLGPAIVTVPNVVGMNRPEAEAALTALDLVLGTTRNLYSYTVPSDHVMRQTPTAGTLVAKGTIISLEISLGAPVTPPDPSTVAPPVDPTVATSLLLAAEFLYLGINPIQVGVLPGTIEEKRVAVLRGKVLTQGGDPLSGVIITVLNHPEYGQTVSREDGMFDMAVNGGGYLTVNYQKLGYLSAQRRLNVPWQEFVWFPEVIMIPLDTQVTSIDLTKPDPIQVARGSVVTDNVGSRQATLLIPSGTTATLVSPDGIAQEIPTLNVRATEYTVGSNGPKAMPAELPPTSGYTYCVEFSADESISTGAQTVQFSQPLIYYVENYLNAAVGSIVPAGYYDRARGIWIPSENGRVIKILSVSGGQAQVDTDGDDLTDNSLGMSDAELQRLATLYSAGQPLWRVPVMHFTPWDYNWGYGPPADATPPEQKPPDQKKKPDCEDEQGGSVIGCLSQTLGEVVDITGTPYSLHYQSDRVPGHKAGYTLEIPLSGATVPDSLAGIELEIYVAGRKFTQSLSRSIPCLQSCPTLGGGGTECVLPTPGNDILTNQTYTFTWDGVDAYGRTLQGGQPVNVRIGYSYCGVYMAPAQLQNSFAALSGVPITGSRSLSQITLWQEWNTWIGPWDARGQGLGGWTLNVHHAYEPSGMKLYLGNGGQRSAKDIALVIKKVAGTGGNYFSGDGGPAVKATLSIPTNVLVNPDGSLYISDTGNSRIRRVGTDGIITTVAGTGVQGYSGDGGPAIDAQLNGPRGIATGPDGSLYTADLWNHRIRRVGTDGIITTVAGTGVQGYSGDGGPAIDAQLNGTIGVAIGPDGSLYVAENQNDRIRRVGPDGIITTVAGTGVYGYSGDGGPAQNARFDSPVDVAVGPDGSFYIADSWNHRIRRVGPNGIITTVAGTGVQGYSGDGGPAIDAQLHLPVSVTVGPDGSLYIGDYWNYRIRRVGPDGIITTVAGKGVTGYSGDNGPARSATLQCPDGLAVGPDGSLFLSDCVNHRVRQVRSIFPEMANLGEIALPSEDGGQIYIFDNAGRHLQTINSITGSILSQFGYNAGGRLTTVTDGNGNVATIQRDSVGNPTSIIAPYGQQTVLTLDPNGYLATIVNPAGETFQFNYTGEGFLTTFTNPRGFIQNFTYDSLGLLTKDEGPAGGTISLTQTETTNGYEVALTTGMNRVTKYLLEQLPSGDEHRVNTLTDGLMIDTLIKTDGTMETTFPNGTTVNDARGPDPRFGMQTPVMISQTIAMPSSLTATATTSRTAILSISDNPLSLSSLQEDFTVNGRRYRTNYTASTKTITDTSPAGRQITSKIDAQGRLVESQIAGFLPVQFTYDTQGRLASVKQGLGPDLRESTYQYNAQGFLHTATDPLLHALAFEYDQAGRVTSGILPDSREISYAYDAGGNMTSLTPSGRPSHVFTYTPVDLIAEYNPPDIGIGTVKTEYSYNTDRQLTQVLRPDGVAFDFSYDSGGRLSAITYPGGPLSYTYDPVKGYLIQIDSPSGISNTYAHDGTLVTSETWVGAVAGSVSWTNDNSFRITGISINGGNAIAYQYDNDSLITKAGDLTLTRSAQNGFLTGSTLGNVTDAWTYNSFGEPASYTARYGANEIFKQQFTYDKLGRISQKVETEGVTDTYEYVYDASGRLTEVKKNGTTTSTYTYDSNDNRLTGPSGTTTYSYDAQDRLITQSSVLGTQSYSHTANGELQSKTISGQTTLYNYDVFGNLKSVTLPGNTLIEYMVDGQNRCIGKKVNSIWVRKFLYLSGLKPVAELDADDAIVSVFVYGSRFNVPDYMIRGGVTYRIISDHLGSPRLVVDTAGGTVIQSIDYDEFGNVVNDTNPGFQPFGFAGGLYDHQTKLVRFGMRDYDAESGRWTTKDPILFGGDQENLYAYVGNDPLNETDVLGTIIFGGGGKRPETPSPNTNIRPPRPTEPPPPPPPPKTPRRPPPDLRGAPGGTWGLKCVPIVVELLRRIVSNPSFIVRAGVRAF